MLKQIKKTFGILLAVCFLISVTAAAASAQCAHCAISSGQSNENHNLADSAKHHNHHNDDDCWVWSPTKKQWVNVC